MSCDVLAIFLQPLHPLRAEIVGKRILPPGLQPHSPPLAGSAILTTLNEDDSMRVW
jgi:hypothetical protein